MLVYCIGNNIVYTTIKNPLKNNEIINYSKNRKNDKKYIIVKRDNFKIFKYQPTERKNIYPLNYYVSEECLFSDSD